MWPISFSFMMVLSLPIKKTITDLHSLHDTQGFTSGVLEKQSLGWVPIAPICCPLTFPKQSLRGRVNGVSDVGEWGETEN